MLMKRIREHPNRTSYRKHNRSYRPKLLQRVYYIRSALKSKHALDGGWGGKETEPDLSEIARTLSFLTSGLQEGRISCQIYYSCETHLVI